MQPPPPYESPTAHEMFQAGSLVVPWYGPISKTGFWINARTFPSPHHVVRRECVRGMVCQQSDVRSDAIMQDREWDEGVYEMRIEADEVKFLSAIETIASNCRDRRVRKLISGHHAFIPKVVRSLARTSPENQRHVVGRALAGDPDPFLKTALSVLVYETVAFREVVSRLERALGLLRAEAAYLNHVKHCRVENVPALADRLATLRLLVEHTRAVKFLLGNLWTRMDPIEEGPGLLPADRVRKPTPVRHAASALGLVAKNLRNIPLLHDNHHPTQAELIRSTALCRVIVREASHALTTACSRWGRVDDGCRVKPRGTPTRRVITHSNPNVDSLVGVWLAERHLLVGEPIEVLFVPRSRVLGAMREGDCLIGVGYAHDPDRLFFDRQPSGSVHRKEPCAARLVYERLVRTGKSEAHLPILVEAVDPKKSATHWVRHTSGMGSCLGADLHRVLANAQSASNTDAGTYRTMRRWLDAYDRPHRVGKP